MNQPDTDDDIFSPTFQTKIKRTHFYGEILIRCEDGEIVLVSTTQKFKFKDLHKILEINY